MTARQLSRPGLDINVAANPVQVEGQRIYKRLPDVVREYRTFALYIRLPPQ